MSPFLHFTRKCTYDYFMGIPLSTPAQIGAAIKGARMRQGWTQSELAERAGVSRRWLITLESGVSERAELGKVLDTLDALDARLEMSAVPSDPLAELLTDVGEP